MKGKYKKALWVLGILLIMCMAAILVFVKYLDFGPDSSEGDKLKFDRTVWMHSHEETDGNMRHYMLTDLKNNYLKKGMDSTKVIRLLGELERRFGFSYNLGFYESGFDPSFLILEFDKKGALVKTSIQTI